MASVLRMRRLHATSMMSSNIADEVHQFHHAQSAIFLAPNHWYVLLAAAGAGELMLTIAPCAI